MFIQFLLIDVFGGDKLGRNDVDDDKLSFVKELFAYRANYEEKRISIFKTHVSTIVRQFVEKMSAENAH